jgi:hypothetical protein
MYARSARIENISIPGQIISKGMLHRLLSTPKKDINIDNVLVDMSESTTRIKIKTTLNSGMCYHKDLKGQVEAEDEEAEARDLQRSCCSGS